MDLKMQNTLIWDLNHKIYSKKRKEYNPKKAEGFGPKQFCFSFVKQKVVQSCLFSKTLFSMGLTSSPVVCCASYELANSSYVNDRIPVGNPPQLASLNSPSLDTIGTGADAIRLDIVQPTRFTNEALLESGGILKVRLDLKLPPGQGSTETKSFSALYKAEVADIDVFLGENLSLSSDPALRQKSDAFLRDYLCDFTQAFKVVVNNQPVTVTLDNISECGVALFETNRFLELIINKAMAAYYSQHVLPSNVDVPRWSTQANSSGLNATAIYSLRNSSDATSQNANSAQLGAGILFNLLVSGETRGLSEYFRSDAPVRFFGITQTIDELFTTTQAVAPATASPVQSSTVEKARRSRIPPVETPATRTQNLIGVIKQFPLTATVIEAPILPSFIVNNTTLRSLFNNVDANARAITHSITIEECELFFRLRRPNSRERIPYLAFQLFRDSIAYQRCYVENDWISALLYANLFYPISKVHSFNIKYTNLNLISIGSKQWNSEGNQAIKTPDLVINERNYPLKGWVYGGSSSPEINPNTVLVFTPQFGDNINTPLKPSRLITSPVYASPKQLADNSHIIEAIESCLSSEIVLCRYPMVKLVPIVDLGTQLAKPLSFVSRSLGSNAGTAGLESEKNSGSSSGSSQTIIP